MCRRLKIATTLTILISTASCSQQPEPPQKTAEQDNVTNRKIIKDAAKPLDVNGNKKGADSAEVSPEEIVRRVAEFYKATKTLKVREEQVMHVQVQGRDKKTTTHRTTVAEKPNRVAMRSEGGVTDIYLVSDGKKLFTYQALMEMYFEEDAPKSIEDLSVDPMMTAIGGELEALVLRLLGDNPYEMLMKGVTELIYMGRETLDGVDVHHLKFIQDQLEWEMWVNSQGDPLISQVSTDLKQSMTFSGNAFESKEMTVTYFIRFRDWKFNEPLDSKEFVFTPPEGAEKANDLLGK